MEAVANPKKSINNHRAEIRGWLAPTFTEDARKEALCLRHKSTCDWVLGLPKFGMWADCDGKTSKILWIHGPAGFGKTVLCGRIIDHMESESSSYGRVLFFFCSGEDHDRKHPFAILKSWIGQLIAKDDTAVEIAMEDDQLQQKISEGTTMSEADLWSLLRKMVTQASRCTLVIDGYDECVDAVTKISKYHTQPWRIHFLKELTKAISGTGTRVLLVSRNQPDIEMVMKESCGDPESLKVIDHAITRDDTTRDVSSFSEAVFARKLTMRAEKRSAMADKAVEKSEGMFLWIALLDKNLREGATRWEVNKLLEETPSEIHDAYRRELDRILNPKGDQNLTARAVVILKWILFATRPLTVREMAEAIAVSFNDSPPEYPHDNLPDPFTEESMDEKYVDNYIRMPCGSLIELRKEDENTPLASHTIHFVHFSVKEFLLQNPFCISKSNRRLCFGEENTEHDWMASLCLQYMCYDEFDNASKNGLESIAAFFGTYPFFSYTVASWHDHFCRGESSDTRPDTPKMVWGLFSTAHWRTWAELFEAHLQDNSRDPGGGVQRPACGEAQGRADSAYGSLDTGQSDDSEDETDDSEDEAGGSGRGPDEDLMLTTRRGISPSPVYYAAILGLSDVVERLIKAKPGDCNLGGGELGSPLQAAVVNRQGPTVKVLLEHKANASQKGGRYGTPLIAAVLLGSDDIFNQLIGSCKELDAVDENGKTALHHACGLGAIDIVTKLVEAGANVNLKSKSGRSPLIRAMMQKHLNVVKYLLDKGADANEITRTQQAPLFLAIEMESGDIVKLLLDHGADLHWQTLRGVTALHAACSFGSAPIARLLLERQAAVEARDDDGWTPLHYAVQENSKECAELMLAHGASPLVEAEDALTPFAMAVRRRATSVIEIFNSHESTSASTTTSLPARLAVALENGYVDLVESLLKGLTRSTVGGDVVRDILALALKTEQRALYNQLSENILKPKGSDNSSVDMYEDAVVWSDTEEKMIRERSWGTDVQRDMVLDPAWRRFPGARDLMPDAMLPVAVANRSHDVVQLLLQRGADMHHRIGGSGGSWSSALQLAVNQNSRELVALMLAESRRSTNNSPALLAALERAGSHSGMTRTDLIKTLIAHGALDADIDDDDGENTDDNVGGTENDSGIEDEQPAAAGAGGGSRADPDPSWWADTLVGKWAGSYSYSYTHSELSDPTEFEIKTVSRESLSALKKNLILFEGGGEDTVAEFTIHGQIMSRRAVRFVKLYPEFGWMYEGLVDKTEGGGWCIKGRWAGQFGGEANGHFMMTKSLSV